MPHGPHRHADIASQAGLSLATVDRVINGRAGVSARAVRAVEQAVLDLDRRMRAMGFLNLDTKVYVETRHESLNEINRDEVSQDFLAWANRLTVRTSAKSVAN